MVSNNHYEGMNEYAVQVITYRAQRLIGTAGFCNEDLEDIEQELMIDFLRRLENYDPSKAKLTTFIDRIVDHRIATLIEGRKAAKRDFRKTSTFSDFDSFNKEASRNTFLEIISTDDYLDRMGHQNRPILDQQDLQIDLEIALEKLTEEERQLMKLLKHMSISEIARGLGIPRTTLNYRIGKVRDRLIDMGIEVYKSNQPSDKAKNR